jgi:hypothetical protein
MELIITHLGGRDILNLCQVSSRWKEIVEESPTAMDKIVFIYNTQSREQYMSTSKQLRHVKVRMGQFLIDPQFSSDVLRFYSTMESISFSGVFFIDSITEFFREIQGKPGLAKCTSCPFVWVLHVAI